MNDLDLLLPRQRVSPEPHSARRRARRHDIAQLTVGVLSLLAFVAITALAATAAIRGW